MDAATGIGIGLLALGGVYLMKRNRQPALPPQYAYESPYANPYDGGGSVFSAPASMSSFYGGSAYGTSPYAQLQQFAQQQQQGLDPNLAKLASVGIQSAPQIIGSLADALGSFGNFAFGSDPVAVSSGGDFLSDPFGGDAFSGFDFGF